MLVREYKSTHAYQSDAIALAAQGWQVASVTERRPRAGCARIFLLGIFALVFPPKPMLVVTYSNQGVISGGSIPLPPVAAGAALPASSSASEQLFEPHIYDVRVLVSTVVAFVLGWIMVGAGNNQASGNALSTIGTVLVLATIGVVAARDWKGFVSLGGVVKWQRMSGGQKFWMVCLYVFLFPVVFGIYLAQAVYAYVVYRKDMSATSIDSKQAVAVTDGVPALGIQENSSPVVTNTSQSAGDGLDSPTSAETTE